MRKRRRIAGRDTRQRPRVGLGAHHHHAMLDLALALVDHRKALDPALARGLGDEVRYLAAVAIGLGLYAGVLRERILWRFARQHQAMMLGNKTALAVEQAELAALAQLA